MLVELCDGVSREDGPGEALLLWPCGGRGLPLRLLPLQVGGVWHSALLGPTLAERLFSFQSKPSHPVEFNTTGHSTT